MSGECNLKLLHEFKENNNDGIYNQNVYCHNNVWYILYRQTDTMSVDAGVSVEVRCRRL